MNELIMPPVIPSHPDLIRVARRLIWWEAPEVAMRQSLRFLAQVMNIGTWTDIGPG